MTKFNVVVPVVCTNFARITVDIPENLIPKFKKFVVSESSLSWNNVEDFLSENNLENDAEGVHLSDRIEESCNQFDSSDLHWDTTESIATEFEYEEIDLDRDWLFKALSEIKDSPAVNMLDRASVIKKLYEVDYIDEAKTLKNITESEYLQLVNEDLTAWNQI